jgi:hypothetical protein
MGVKKSEKLNEEFSNHKRPHLTTDTHIKNNDKRKVALLLGEIPSLVCPLFSCVYEDYRPVCWLCFRSSGCLAGKNFHT